jgi:hypothetical protein
MARQLTVVSNSKPPEHYEVLSPEEKMMHVRNVTGVVLQDAADVWSELWNELQGKVTDNFMILPRAEKGLRPECGWPEYLEKMWRLKHYLDCARRLTAGEV